MKKVSLLFILLIFVSCLFTAAAYGKGGIGDNDAFSTYIGKSKTEVRKIAPSFEDWDDGLYIVDSMVDGDDLMGILVSVDKNNIVEGVTILVSSGLLKAVDLDDNKIGAATFGLITLGFDAEDIIKTTDENDSLILILKKDVYVGVNELSSGLYMIAAIQ